jgi:hypothetical protein
MYMNRLRVDHLVSLLRAARHDVLLLESDENAAIKELLLAGD